MSFSLKKLIMAQECFRKFVPCNDHFKAALVLFCGPIIIICVHKGASINSVLINNFYRT